MAAGLGFKDFVTGEVLTASDVDGYLMQGIWVFASAAARDAAVTSPQEGNFAFLKDTNTTTYYTGSAWTNLDTTGMVNPMTTTGDMVYSSSGSTPARLGIGSTGNVLTVSGGVPVWSAPAGGGKVLQVINATTASGGAETTVSTTTFTDTGLSASITPTSATSKILILASQNIYSTRDNTEAASYLRLMRDSTNIFALNDSGGLAMFVRAAVSTTLRIGGFCPVVYLDNPATTSSITYKLQGAPPTTAGNATVVYQANSSRSSITLMEIGA